ncbi:Phosphoribosylformylglycinamidine synthase 2 [uncultured Desulfobacterium sp.]|uniref:Phosphoribosylformylglycinamidine synthase subunit PurL n=1 Tax=uncultured Desulfobacterium sp. TaxID=201089 RepID=A0A445MQQ0_9BACT|nr:Phosphoribosylformylglycinamidine synthase 2 [uncultured Desulfobacterium sp.]
MASRLEIRLKKELVDAEGAGVRRKAREYFGFEVEDVRVIRVLTFDTDLGPDQLERVRVEIFTNPVTEESSFSPITSFFDWLIWIGFLPGVRDTQGSTAKEAIEDLLGIRIGPEQGLYTSKIYEFRGNLAFEQVNNIAAALLANDIIQQWRIFSNKDWNKDQGIGFPIPKVILNHKPQVSTIPIKSDEELKKISLERNLALQDRDIPVIREYFSRQDVLAARKEVGLDLPTDVELEYISQARSDHCNHNTFRGRFRYHDLATGHREEVNNLFKTCIEAPTLKIKEEKDWVKSVLWDNAGVGKFDDDHYYVITGETHNSPSNMEAYGGAITGIVGIYRDPMGTGKGSRLILGMYGYCVGPRDYDGELRPHLHPRRLLDGIIEGVKDGGNKSGIPTPFGLLVFDEGYLGKCLVFVTAMGIMPAMIAGEPSYEKTTSPGDLIIMSGGRVGKDGIHGVTASSEVYSEHTPAGHVQIGDPYTQKKMHDFLLEARDEGLITFITDNGGGGLSSSIGESSRFSNGCLVHLDKVPLKYDGLDQWEIWISESQERMTIAIRPENLDRFMALSEKHAVESTVIGQYNDSGYLRLDYEGRTCAYIRMDLLESDFPQWEFDAQWIPPHLRGLTEPVITEPENYGALLNEILSRPNICSRNWIARQYDHEVQGGSVIKPLVGIRCDIPSDAAVSRPVLGSNRGIAFSQAIIPFYSTIDTYNMTAATIDEAVRKILAVGGDPGHIGGVDNFCWPTIEYHPTKNPDGKFKAAQLVRSNWALRDYCLAYGIPLLSGKDSMYIDGNLEGPYGERRKVSGLPTLLFTACGVIDDISKCITMDAKFPGDLVYILGETKNELGGGEYYHMMGYTGLNVPAVNAQGLLPQYRALHKAISEGLVSSCHSVARGGLAVHLSMVAMAGELGMEIDLGKVPAVEGLTSTQLLYSETCGRFIITVAPENRKSFEDILAGASPGLIGVVKEKKELTVSDSHGRTIIREEVSTLKASWKRSFGDLI